MLKDAAEVALCIENNAELLVADAALADARLGRPQADHSRSSLPRKREASPSQDNCVWSGNQSRQQQGAHRFKRKDRSRVRFEERV
jgi:hypothetical protein